MPLVFLLLLIAPFFCSAEEFKLKEKLSTAKEGNYLVFEQNKNFTFFHIFEVLPKRVIIEEVSIPDHLINSQCYQGGWREWFERGAPHHTSWTIALVNLSTGRFEELYSFTCKGWVDITKMDSFMSTLLNLSFQEIPEGGRRRMGLPPARSKPDIRPLWTPRLVVDGGVLPQIPFSAWRSRWPSDGSELSRKTIDIYLPEERDEPLYPTFFPYWVDIEGKIGTAKIRVVDSGLYAKSPQCGLPKRPPSLLGTPHLSQEGLSITLKSPPYYSNFLLLAEESNGFFAPPTSLPFTLQREGERVTLFVERETLLQQLLIGHSYHFLISPQENESICLQTKPIYLE